MHQFNEYEREDVLTFASSRSSSIQGEEKKKNRVLAAAAGFRAFPLKVALLALGYR